MSPALTRGGYCGVGAGLHSTVQHHRQPWGGAERGGETSNQAGSQSPSYYGHHHMSMSSSDYIIRLLILWLARGKEGREIIILCRQ